MKKVIFLLFFFSFFVLTCFAQSTIAVLDFTTENSELESKMSMMTDMFRVEVSKVNGVNIVDRKHTNEVLTELSFQMSSYTSNNSVKSVGEMLNADFVVIGNVEKIENDPEKYIRTIPKEIVDEPKGLMGAITRNGKKKNCSRRKRIYNSRVPNKRCSSVY